MAALSKNISRALRDGRSSTAGVQAGATVRQGSLLEVDGSGHVAPATRGANKIYIGVAERPATGTSTAGETRVPYGRGPVYHFDFGGTADNDTVGRTVYVLDDNTVTDVAAGASKLGVIADVDDDGVWVDITRVAA